MPPCAAGYSGSLGTALGANGAAGIDLIGLHAISDVYGIASARAITDVGPFPITSFQLAGDGSGLTFALVSDGDLGSLYLSIFDLATVGSSAVPSSPLRFAFETGAPQDAGNFLRVTAGNLGYTLTVQSDVEAAGVPESGTTMSLLGLGLAGIAAVRRKLALS